MPCFPPVFNSVTRRAKLLFKRSRRELGETSPIQSSSTELPSGAPESKAVDSGSSSGGDGQGIIRSCVCDFCWNKGLFSPGPFQQAWNSQTSYRDFSATTTWAQVEASAGKNCHWCKLLLSTRTEATLQDDVQYSVGLRIDSGRSAATPKGTQTLRLEVDGTPHSIYYVYTDRDNPATPLIAARPRVLLLNSPATFSMAASSVMACIRAHEHCPTPHVATLPTRVIDCSDPTRPKLHISGDGENASYLVLSYVWGEEHAHCTTTANVDTYKLGIDPGSLPQTIQDAMHTTRSLGLQYLWVDALCILQDSEEDKAQEVARIGTTFRNAYFTIVAATTRNAGEGFLHNRAPPSPPDILLPFRFPDGQVGKLWLSPAWRQYDSSSEPINQRAWCLGERLLSPRALVFASHTLQYQCKTATINVGDAVCAPTVTRRLPDILFRTDAELSKPLTQDEMKTLQYAWTETVAEYSQRALTLPEDKLVAFAPIAELFQRAWRAEYLAGLWRETLIDDLLWYKNSGTRLGRPHKYRAPSWSWAAIDGRIMPHTSDDRLDTGSAETESCEVVSCTVTAATSVLPLGEVIAGTLSIRAVMVPATWDPHLSLPDLYLQPSDAMPGQLELPRRRPSASEASASDLVHIGSAYPDGVETVHEVWAVPVRWNTVTEYAAGLIVARAMEGGAGRFRRVGYFRTSDSAPPGGLVWMAEREVREIVLV